MIFHPAFVGKHQVGRLDIAMNDLFLMCGFQTLARVMVALMKRLGMTYEYLEIPGGPHDVSATAPSKTVEFFNRHKRKPAPDD